MATGAGTLLPLYPLPSSYPFSVTPRRGIALPSCLMSNALDQCYYYQRDLTSMVTNFGPKVPWFSHLGTVTLSSPTGPLWPSRITRFFCLRTACGRVWVSLLYVSMNSFVTCLGYIILGARGGGFLLWIQGV